MNCHRHHPSILFHANGLAQRQRRDRQDPLLDYRANSKNGLRSRAAQPLSAEAGVGRIVSVAKNNCKILRSYARNQFGLPLWGWVELVLLLDTKRPLELLKSLPISQPYNNFLLNWEPCL